ncbi:MAG: hypothetical protein H7Z42_17270 [Roseiflexaceae bacterium]|nr:hypothetical protein [Roseiflexaceae bacterium]
MEPSELEEPSKELARLAEEQLNDADSDSDDRRTRGRKRRTRVLELYNQGYIDTSIDHYHAALVMLYGDDVSHFELARSFARRSVDLGSHRAWSIIAAAWDRALIQRGKPQRFGTQFVREQGRWTLGRIDPKVRDAERALYGVPPLWVQEQAVERLQRREERE